MEANTQKTNGSKNTDTLEDGRTMGDIFEELKVREATAKAEHAEARARAENTRADSNEATEQFKAAVQAGLLSLVEAAAPYKELGATHAALLKSRLEAETKMSEEKAKARLETFQAVEKAKQEVVKAILEAKTQPGMSEDGKTFEQVLSIRDKVELLNELS